jgi:hypothetical protein
LKSPDVNDILNRLVSSLLYAIEISAWVSTRDHFEILMDEYTSEYSKIVDDISVASVQSAAQEGALLLETIRVSARLIRPINLTFI